MDFKLTILIFAIMMTLATANEGHLVGVVVQSVGTYFENYYKYTMWLMVDAACLMLGWFGIISGDSGITFINCEYTYMNYWSM